MMLHLELTKCQNLSQPISFLFDHLLWVNILSGYNLACVGDEIRIGFLPWMTPLNCLDGNPRVKQSTRKLPILDFYNGHVRRKKRQTFGKYDEQCAISCFILDSRTRIIDSLKLLKLLNIKDSDFLDSTLLISICQNKSTAQHSYVPSIDTKCFISY